MANIDAAQDILNGLEFRKDDYLGAEKQLAAFAEVMARLSADDAEALRKEFGAKQRLGWFRTAASLLSNGFEEADHSRKDRLLKIFFALYCLDNLDFGYDSLLDVLEVAELVKSQRDLAVQNWEMFCGLLSRDTARTNMENKVFSD